MKTFAVFLSALTLSQAGPAKRAACNADNCARAVTGTAAGGLSSHLADCSSFFRYTVTPATQTVTAFATATQTQVSVVTQSVFSTETDFAIETDTTTIQAPLKRQATTTPGPVTKSPTAVPSYASVCSGASKYSSACSCAGVSKSTITAAAPQTTTTSTVSTTLVLTSTITAVYPATVTESSTVIVTQTAPAPPKQALCGQTVSPGGACGCSFDVQCNATRGKPEELLDNSQFYYRDEVSCIKECDNYADCVYADWKVSTGQCSIYGTSDGNVPSDSTPSSDDDFISFNIDGACSNYNCPSYPN